MSESRPLEPEQPQTVTQPKRPVADILGLISAKQVAQIAKNEKLKPCCRDVFSHQVEFAKTRPDLPNPDHLVFECQCGRRHKIFGLGAAQSGVK